jgi:hypothetical protein
MANKPRGRIGRSDLLLNLHGAHAFLAIQHLPEHFKPRLQWIVRVLENGLDQNRETIGLTFQGVWALRALPVERARLGLVNLIVSASRAADSVRPAAFHQEPFTSRFIGKSGHQLLERHHG